MKNSKCFSAICVTLIVCAGVSGCVTTPEQRAAQVANFREKVSGMPVRSYLVYRFNRPLNAPIVPLAPLMKTYIEDTSYWLIGTNYKVEAYDESSQEKTYCEANNGRLEYLGAVSGPVPVATVIQSRSDYARSNPYAIITDASHDIYVYSRRVPDNQITKIVGEHIRKIQAGVDGRAFGKFQCRLNGNDVLFKVSYIPIAISAGDNRPGQVPTAIGVTIQTQYRFEFK